MRTRSFMRRLRRKVSKSSQGMRGGILQRAFAALVILAVTLFVSVVWQKMVYTIPVLAVLLYFAAGVRADGATRKQNLDQDGSEFEVGAD